MRLSAFIRAFLVLACAACARAPSPPAQVPSPTPSLTPSPAASPTMPSPTPGPPPAPAARPCVEPEPAAAAGALPGKGGVFKIEAAPCTRELALRDFALIYRFWSNVDGNPFKRKPGYGERAEFFVEGQPAGEMWRWRMERYARDGVYAVWDPRGFRADLVRAVYQDPGGGVVWVFYERGALTYPLKRLSDDSQAGEEFADTGIMMWRLEWDGTAKRYRAVSYNSRADP